MPSLEIITPEPMVEFLELEERGSLLVLTVITEDNAFSISIEFEQEHNKKTNTPKRPLVENL